MVDARRAQHRERVFKNHVIEVALRMLQEALPLRSAPPAADDEAMPAWLRTAETELRRTSSGGAHGDEDGEDRCRSCGISQLQEWHHITKVCHF